MKVVCETAKRVLSRLNTRMERRMRSSLTSRSSRMMRRILSCDTALLCRTMPTRSNGSTETKSTLKFGQRAKQIKNKAKVNKEFSIKELKYMLQMAEKEIRLNAIRIKELEEYIAMLEAKGVASDDKELIE